MHTCCTRFTIVKKHDVTNFENCPLNRFPVKVPSYNDKAFKTARWPYRKNPNDPGGPMAIDCDENGLNEDGLPVDQCYVMYIKNMGFYEKQTWRHLTEICDTVGLLRKLKSSYSWVQERVKLWPQLTVPYNQSNVWGGKSSDYWKSVENKFLHSILTQDLKYEFAGENMFHLNGTNWLTDREINSFGALLNNQQEIVEVLCIETWAAETWKDLSSLPAKNNVHYSYVLGQHKKKAKYIVDTYIKNAIEHIIKENKTFKINTILFPINLGRYHWVFGKISLSDLDVIIRNSWPGSTASNLKHEEKLFYKSLAYLIPQYLSSNAFKHKDKFDFTNGNKMKKWTVKNDIIQFNGSDCGVFVCIEMEANVKNQTHLIKLENLEIYQHARLYILGKMVL
eukprot:407075_1